MASVAKNAFPRSILSHLLISRAQRDNRPLTTSEQESVKDFETVAAQAERDEKPSDNILAFIRRGAR